MNGYELKEWINDLSDEELEGEICFVTDTYEDILDVHMFAVASDGVDIDYDSDYFRLIKQLGTGEKRIIICESIV